MPDDNSYSDDEEDSEMAGNCSDVYLCNILCGTVCDVSSDRMFLCQR